MHITLRRVQYVVAMLLVTAVSLLLGQTASAEPLMADATAPPVSIASQPGKNGYALLDANGHVYAFGTDYFGGASTARVAPFVSMAYTPTGKGYALLDSQGHVYNYGDSQYKGGAPSGAALPFVSIAYKPGTLGYTLMDSVGHIYNYGTDYLPGTHDYGRKYTGFAYTPSGKGYTLMSETGGIYNYGDSQYKGGSPAGATLPIRGFAYKTGTYNYTMIDAVGHVYNYGTDYRGGFPQGAVRPFVGLVYTPSGNGYAMADAVGHMYSYGDSQYQGGFSSIRGSGPAQPTAGLIGGSDRDLANKILNSGKVAGDSRYIGQIRNYANGNYSCHINPTILSVIYTTVAPTSEGGLNRSIKISSLNRKCTGVITASGTSSYHYTNGGGHAVDIGTINNVTSTGSTANDLSYLRALLPKLPRGSGIGQSNCRSSSNALAMPSGIAQFTDSCDHNHIQVPIR